LANLSAITIKERIDRWITRLAKETSVKLPIGGRGRVIDVKWIQRDPFDIMVHLYILQKREIEVGDKVAGRHGNKGIISLFSAHPYNNKVFTINTWPTCLSHKVSWFLCLSPLP
jgi:DNA-directed RNA polymerase beta subunit